MAAASECDLEGFLKFVLQKTEELSLSKDGGSFSENFLSELLTHVDLLGKTTQLSWENNSLPPSVINANSTTSFFSQVSNIYCH